VEEEEEGSELLVRNKPSDLLMLPSFFASKGYSAYGSQS